MATEALVSHHTSATDQVEKKENEEVTANGQKSVSLSNANEEKNDKVEDTTLSETKTEDKVEVQKTDAFKEKEAITDSQTIKIKTLELNPAIESELVKEKAEPEVAEAQEISQETEKEAREHPSTVAVMQSETVGKKPREPEPLVEVVKPETEVAEAQEKSQEHEQESLQKEQENTAVVVPEETIKTVSEAVEEKQEPEAEVVKETETSERASQDVERPEPVEGNPKTESEAEGVEDSDASSDEVEKPEGVVAKVQEKSKEASEKGEEDRENTAAVVLESSTEPTKEVSEVVEEEQEPHAEVMKETEISETGSQIVDRPETIEGDPKPESEAERVKETENSETSSDQVEKPEPAVAQEQEKSKEDSEKEEEENKVAEVTEGSSETVEKAIEEDKPGQVVKETEEPESAVTKIEEVKLVENEGTMIPEKTAEKPLDIIEDHSTRESDTQIVKETNKIDALPVEAERPQVESGKPIEQSQVALAEVEDESKDVEEKPREVEQSQAEVESRDLEAKLARENENDKSEGTSDTTVPTSLKEGETQKEEETTVTNNSEAQAAAVEEDHKKESSHSDVVQDLVKDVVGAPPTAEQVAYKKESNVEEKVTANDGKESSREAVVGTHEVGEQNQAKTGTTAEAGDKVECVKHEDGHQEPKGEEVIAAVSEPVRETLAFMSQEKEESKLETQHVEETQEPSAKENDTIKTSKELPKETPAKLAQKHSNNIISKVKQSLVKAKKAIIRKSPSSKTLSSNTQGDIKVK